MCCWRSVRSEGLNLRLSIDKLEEVTILAGSQGGNRAIGAQIRSARKVESDRLVFEAADHRSVNFTSTCILIETGTPSR